MEVKKCSRGVLLSLGALVLGLVIISFASVIFTSMMESKEYTSQAESISITSEEAISFLRILRELYPLSGARYHADPGSITFAETFPNPNASIFRSRISGLEAFAAQQGIKDIYLEDAKELRMKSENYNISYGHDVFGEDISIYFGRTGSLEIALNIEENVTSCSFDYEPGMFNITITAVGTYSTSCSYDEMIDPYQISFFELNNMLNITIVGNSAKLEHSFGKLSSGITFNVDGESGEPNLYYEGIILNMTAPYSVSKEGKARISR